MDDEEEFSETSGHGWMDFPDGVKLVDEKGRVIFNSRNQREATLTEQVRDYLRRYAQDALRHKQTRRGTVRFLGCPVTEPVPQPYLQQVLDDLENATMRYQVTFQFTGAYSNRESASNRTTDKLATGQGHPVRANLLHECLANVEDDLCNKLCCGTIHIYLCPIYMPTAPTKARYIIHIIGGISISQITGQIARFAQTESKAGVGQAAGLPVEKDEKILAVLCQLKNTHDFCSQFSSADLRSGSLVSITRMNTQGELLPDICRRVLESPDGEHLHVQLMKAFGYTGLLNAMEEACTDTNDKTRIAPSFVNAVLHRLAHDQRRRIAAKTKRRHPEVDGGESSSDTSDENDSASAEED